MKFIIPLIDDKTNKLSLLHVEADLLRSAASFAESLADHCDHTVGEPIDSEEFASWVADLVNDRPTVILDRKGNFQKHTFPTK